jgi:hypothetical protein
VPTSHLPGRMEAPRSIQNSVVELQRHGNCNSRGCPVVLICEINQVLTDNILGILLSMWISNMF